MANSTFKVELRPFDAPPASSAYAGGLQCPVTKSLNWVDGDLTNQLRGFKHVSQAIAASTTLPFDLQTGLDRYGVALAATDIPYLYVEHAAASLAVLGIALEPNATTGWSSLIGSSGATDRGRIILFPGDFIFMASPVAGNQAVSGTSKKLDVINLDGANPADVIIQHGFRR